LNVKSFTRGEGGQTEINKEEEEEEREKCLIKVFPKKMSSVIQSHKRKPGDTLP
jgi:hypothetical protein